MVTGPSAAAAGGSWGCYAGLASPRCPDAAAAVGVASGGWPAEAEPGRMEAGGRLGEAEGPEVAAGGLPYPLHLDLRHLLADQPWRSAAASGDGVGAGAGASAGVQQPAAGPLFLGSLAPAGLGDHQAAEDPEGDLRVGPVLLGEAAFQAGPCSPGPGVAVAAGTDRG